MSKRPYYIHSDKGMSATKYDADAAIDLADSWVKASPQNVSVSDDRGRVFAFFCEHGGMRDSTMGELLCCEDARLEVSK